HRGDCADARRSGRDGEVPPRGARVNRARRRRGLIRRFWRFTPVGRGGFAAHEAGVLGAQVDRSEGFRLTEDSSLPAGGAVAQLGERLNGIQEVTSSTLVSSTNKIKHLANLVARKDGRRWQIGGWCPAVASLDS